MLLSYCFLFPLECCVIAFHDKKSAAFGMIHDNRRGCNIVNLLFFRRLLVQFFFVYGNTIFASECFVKSCDDLKKNSLPWKEMRYHKKEECGDGNKQQWHTGNEYSGVVLRLNWNPIRTTPRKTDSLAVILMWETQLLLTKQLLW